MTYARQKPPRHNVARLRLFLGKSQREMADIAGCSFDTIQSVELGRLALSEDLARRISAATDVHLHWLLDNDLEADIVETRGHPYTHSVFENRQAQRKFGDNELSRQMMADYAASFYGQIRAILSSASKKDLAEVATWKVAKYLDDCRREFGHDKKLIGTEEQFGLRADDSPYLKFRQVTAGINLFKKYVRERKASIQRTMKALKERKPLVTDMGPVQITMGPVKKPATKKRTTKQSRPTRYRKHSR
jgi:transcriptional regulator with XRE-family HTH domain